MPTDPFITRHIITNRREISLSFQLDQNSQIQKKVQEHSNPNRFSRTKIQQIQWSLHRFSEIPYWIFIIESVFSAIQARTHHPKAASSSAITEGEFEKKRERIQGFRISSGEKEEDYGSNPKFKPRNQRNRIKIQGFWRFRLKISRLNTGNTQTQSHTVKKPSQVRKQRESMEDSNCLVRNPNPNIKTVWKRRESLQDSQRVWIGVIPCWFTKIELKKHEESQTVRTYRQNQKFVLIPRLKTSSSNGFVIRTTIQSV